MDEAEYQKEYQKAAAELEAQATGTAAPAVQRAGDGTFAKPEPVAKAAQPEEKQEPQLPVEPATPVEIDPLAEIKAQLEKTQKALKDTQAWGTKSSQELAALKRESDERKRQESRPAILDANPELEAAIRHVVPQQAEPQEDRAQQWQAVVSAAHPGIFDKSIDPELEQALVKRLGALGGQAQDPLIVIREITEEKIAHTERQIGKRFAAEAAKSAQKSAMSMPGAGAGSAQPAQQDADLAAKNRILNMSPAEFEKERRRVMGY